MFVAFCSTVLLVCSCLFVVTWSLTWPHTLVVGTCPGHLVHRYWRLYGSWSGKWYHWATFCLWLQGTVISDQSRERSVSTGFFWLWLCQHGYKQDWPTAFSSSNSWNVLGIGPVSDFQISPHPLSVSCYLNRWSMVLHWDQNWILVFLFLGLPLPIDDTLSFCHAGGSVCAGSCGVRMPGRRAAFLETGQVEVPGADSRWQGSFNQERLGRCVWLHQWWSRHFLLLWALRTRSCQCCRSAIMVYFLHQACSFPFPALSKFTNW